MYLKIKKKEEIEKILNEQETVLEDNNKYTKIIDKTEEASEVETENKTLHKKKFFHKKRKFFKKKFNKEGNGSKEVA